MSTVAGEITWKRRLTFCSSHFIARRKSPGRETTIQPLAIYTPLTHTHIWAWIVCCVCCYYYLFLFVSWCFHQRGGSAAAAPLHCRPRSRVNKLSKPFCCFERSIAFLLALGVCGRLSVVFSLVFCLLFSSPFHFRLLCRAGMDILSDALRSVTDWTNISTWRTRRPWRRRASIWPRVSSPTTTTGRAASLLDVRLMNKKTTKETFWFMTAVSVYITTAADRKITTTSLHIVLMISRFDGGFS